jgi:hypothetical protein
LPPGKIHIHKISDYQGDGMVVEDEEERLKKKEKENDEDGIKDQNGKILQEGRDNDKNMIDIYKARYAVFVTQGRRVLTQGVYSGMMLIPHLCQELSLQIELENKQKTPVIYAYGAFKEFFFFFFFFFFFKKKENYNIFLNV